ncbi:MAG: ribosomal RNA small subunit methyltransferase A [Chitinivibrionales bacterium]|nr:ribosomal RNA small subunit methyltransferase A [Chitinivibrionales bacterium]
MTIPVTPKKKYGQHFLTAPYYAEKIANTLQCSESATVVEIGPGTGALSKFLVRRFPSIHFIETDPEVLPALEKTIGPGAWTVHRADAVTFDFTRVEPPVHIIGNLPYNRAAMILRNALLCAPHVASLTCMVQAEVAGRIVSLPHCKSNGFLTIFCQFFGKPRLLFHVPPGAFFPKPKVNSSVFTLAIDEGAIQRLTRHHWSGFFSFVSDCFCMRRKTLMNNLLRRSSEKRAITSIFDSQGWSLTLRPEDLSVNDWLILFKMLKESTACAASF